jgi:hypothetical protein
VQLHKSLEPYLTELKKEFAPDSPSRSTATPEPVFDRVLSDVLLLVRFSDQILEPGSRRDPRVVAHRRGGARESKPLEIAGH